MRRLGALPETPPAARGRTSERPPPCSGRPRAPARREARADLRGRRRRRRRDRDRGARRIDDETAGIPLVSTARRRLRGHAAAVARLLHLQAAVHGGRRVLPPALPRVRGASTTPSATPAPTSPGAARCSPAAAPRSACTSRCGCCATAPTPRSPRGSPTTPSAASRAMHDSADWLHRLRVVGIDLRDPAQVVALADSVAGAGPARHPDQQRRADRAPLARRVRAAGRGRVRAAAGRDRAARSDLRPHQRRAPARARRAVARDHPALALDALTGLALTRPSSESPRARATDRLGGHRDRRRRPGARHRDDQQLGRSASTRSTRWSCSRCSCATRPRRSS